MQCNRKGTPTVGHEQDLKLLRFAGDLALALDDYSIGDLVTLKVQRGADNPQVLLPSFSQSHQTLHTMPSSCIWSSLAHQHNCFQSAPMAAFACASDSRTAAAGSICHAENARKAAACRALKSLRSASNWRRTPSEAIALPRNGDAAF